MKVGLQSLWNWHNLISGRSTHSDLTKAGSTTDTEDLTKICHRGFVHSSHKKSEKITTKLFSPVTTVSHIPGLVRWCRWWLIYAQMMPSQVARTSCELGTCTDADQINSVNAKFERGSRLIVFDTCALIIWNILYIIFNYLNNLIHVLLESYLTGRKVGLKNICQYGKYLKSCPIANSRHSQSILILAVLVCPY